MMKRKLTLALATILCISMVVPMIYAPNQRPHDFIVQYIQENDPSLMGPASSMLSALDKVERLEEDLGIDLTEKSKPLDLSPKDQAKLDRAIDKATDRIERFVEKAGLDEVSGEKYIGETEKNLGIFIETQLIWLRK